MEDEPIPPPGTGDDAPSGAPGQASGTSHDAPDVSPDAAGIAPAGFRAPVRTRLGRVRFQVADLERSLGFYRDLLGFRVLEEDGAMAVLGATEPLIELVERRGAEPVPPTGRLGLFHVAILLPDRPSLGRILRRLSRAGVRLGSADHLVSEALYLSDPDGLGLEIYADRPRTEWSYAPPVGGVHAGREIAMATEPLDARGLLAAGGDASWSGMPAGASIGHVHLSVSDLALAERFFHAGLGLDKVVWSFPGALFLSAGGYHHHIGANTWARGAAPAGASDARLLEWRLVMPHADAVSDALQSLADAGFADRVDRPGSRATDPWGVRVRLDTRG